MQISFLKDLVSLRNPTSPYSFVNYLHKHGRLVDFINLGTFYPCRMEFNDYLRWVAGHFAEQSRYGEEVLSVEPMLVERKVEALRVTSRNAEGEELVRTTRSVVVSAGGTPRIPLAFRHLKDDGRVFHHSQYLERMLKQPCVNGQPMKVAIIGGGQSAAEAFIDLNDSYPSVQVDLILRGSALKPADDSPFVNEVFAPEFTDLIYNQEGAERERLVREYHNTNYSVVDIDLIERIYGIFYRQKVSGVPRHAFRSLRSVEKATAGAEGIELALRNTANGELSVQRYDLVILATGYERQLHRQLLEPMADYLGDFEVDRNYRLITDQRCQASIMQGFCQASHGLSDTPAVGAAGACRGNLRLPVPAPEARYCGPRPARARPGQLIGATPPRPVLPVSRPPGMPGTQGVFVMSRPFRPPLCRETTSMGMRTVLTGLAGMLLGSMMPVQADMPRPTGLAADIRWTAYGVPHPGQG